MRFPPSVALVAAVAGLGLLVAGCGGRPGPTVASLGTTSTPTTTSSTTGGGGGGSSPPSSSGGHGTMSMVGGSAQQMTKFASCMRRNGEPGFPDPNAQGEISTDLDPGSAQFQKAQQACRKLLPQGGTPSPAQQARMRRSALAFSACMRSHGEPSFPDPQFGAGGSVRLRISAGSGLDPRSPQFQAAQKACQKDMPGKVGTKAVAGGSSSG